jgi:hypothetical protein
VTPVHPKSERMPYRAGSIARRLRGKRSSVSRRIATALLVGVLVLAGALTPAWASYRCRVDGVVRSECCCPTPKADVASQATTRPACCDVARSEPLFHPPSATVQDEPVLAVPICSPVPQAFVPPSTTDHSFDTEPIDHPRPPIFLLKRTFLI